MTKAKSNQKMISPIEKANKTRSERGCYKAAGAKGWMLPGEVLERDTFCERFGTTRNQIYKWQRKGLVVRALGKSRFIRAEDFSAFLATLGASDATT